jgi:osmotically-inducible protein OsmY
MTTAHVKTGIGPARAAVIFAALLLAGPCLTLAQERAVTDENIRDAVEDAIFFDKAVQLDPIDVTCVDGIVTLSGTTDNILAKKRAGRLAETVKGVRSVVNLISVKPLVDRSSAALENAIEVALLADPAADSYEITVEADSTGHVTLTGTAESWQEKRLAEKIAMGVSGVTGITNDIDVEYKSDRADQEIKPEIEEALEWNALVDDQFIDVSVNDGKVKLTGTVGTAAEKRQARYSAWVAGVTEVDDSGLKVRNWARDEERRNTAYTVKPAGEIKDAIRDANLQDPRVKSFTVDPSVSGSVVTLRGVVESLRAKRAAAENARNTIGVSRVKNRLKVRPAVAHADDKIENDVRDALLRDPYVDRYELNVDVINGTAYLTGSVDSYFEKAQAEDDAARVKGVVEVSNAITVTETDRPMIYDPYIHDTYTYDYDWYDYKPGNLVKPDSQIRQSIEEQLWWSPFVDSDDVDVTVEKGVATLTGTVDSWSEYHSASENALEGGAIAVDNDLVVMTP